jgi:hypothetical protein
MSDDRRNPYFILGIDYGASRDAARKASGRVLRRVRRDADARYGVEDVTWALHQVEQAIEDPASAVHHYRVPADPSLFVEMGGLETPALPLRRNTSKPTNEELAAIRLRAFDEAVDALFRSSSEHIDVSVLFPRGKDDPQ